VCASLPKVYDFREVEEKWQRKWEEWGIYRFDREDKYRPTYSIDTPPPYPSGEFHMGNAFNWCYFDLVARYMRMKGYNVHFPQGWDCHGLPTEVRAEKELGVSKRDMSPSDFERICMKLTEKWIDQMKKTMKRIGYSIDWSLEYRTMDPDYWRRTQLSFILMYKKGFVYRAEHPVLWCPRCETAIAEAEVEYVNRSGKLYYIKFPFSNGSGYIVIATTRPELLPACVAAAVNPSDERYKEVVGRKLVVPIFNREIKIHADEEVDPEFGTGVVMICTFGDKTDVKWQRKYKLPIIKVIDEKGYMTEEAGKYSGLTIEECKRKIVQDLKDAGFILKEENIVQNIGTCWRCHTPIEILVKKQWFVKTKQITNEVLRWAEKIRWVPAWAKNRLIDWVNSLDWDWVISRQRIFATPIPVWYCNNCNEIIIAEEDWVPIDPRREKPRIDKCPKCGSKSFRGETDVMDTWMDSSITCAVHAGWPDDMELFSRLFPADLQPNGYDIIRTWDYYLMVRGIILFGNPQFKTALINGMVRGTDGRMMHKSYGNYVSANEVLEKYGADALRQWAFAGGSVGSDVPFRWEDVDYGWRFQLKLWNASRFVSFHIKDFQPGQMEVKLELLDKWLLSKLEKLTMKVTEALDDFQFNVALESIRQFFWRIFCDQYIEAVKHRLYQKEKIESRFAAQYTLYEALFRFLQLLAPFIPHITEEIYYRIYREDKKFKSIHISPWPTIKMENINNEAEKQGDLLVAVISEIRRLKAQMKIPLSKMISRAYLYAGLKEYLELLKRYKREIGAIIKVEEIKLITEEIEDMVEVRGYPDIKVKIEV